MVRVGALDLQELLTGLLGLGLGALVGGGEAEAEQAREELLQIQGTDANHSAEKIVKIREIAE